MDESGLPGFETDSWNGLLAPAGTPGPVLDRLNAEVNKALASPDVREKLAAQGAMVVGGTRQDFRHYLQSEVERCGTVFRTLKISL
ncbi:tripartite tricarboxylate transporter substrate-binding protein [Cupriavidus basilensis]|uniref:tripartite tricarboxylate transporter substrate-binding protein n=1 Tax=Cupriavidus basilensis TaxID=68895 RepID=UPI0039F72513